MKVKVVSLWIYIIVLDVYKFYLVGKLISHHYREVIFALEGEKKREKEISK